MVYLDCSGIRFGSQLDEKHLFEWASEISCVVRWENDILVVKSRRISEAALRDLVALFWRYEIPMEQLAQFRNSTNESWFAAPIMYWHAAVFSPDSRLKRTRARAGTRRVAPRWSKMRDAERANALADAAWLREGHQPDDDFSVGVADD